MMLKSLFKYVSWLVSLATLTVFTGCLVGEEQDSFADFPFGRHSWKVASVVSDVARDFEGYVSTDWQAQQPACRQDDFFHAVDYHRLDADEGETMFDLLDVNPRTLGMVVEHRGGSNYRMWLTAKAKKMIFGYSNADIEDWKHKAVMNWFSQPLSTMKEMPTM